MPKQGCFEEWILAEISNFRSLLADSESRLQKFNQLSLSFKRRG
jgi:hypothetical protein